MEQSNSEKSRDPNSAFFSRTDIVFLCFVAVFLFLQLFILPFTPVYVEGDQLLPISNAMRLLDGEVMYRDFFHFAPPGAELYYAAAFSLFGVKIWVMNATVLILALAQLLLVFIFSKRILTGAAVFLPTLLFFVLGFRLYGIDGSYRLFSVVFVLIAVWLIWRHLTLPYLAVAGVLCGISSFFVQTRGILGIGAIGLYILWLHWHSERNVKWIFRDWGAAAGGFVLTVGITQFIAAGWGGFDNYFFANFTFLKDHYGSDTLSNTSAYFSDLPNVSNYLNTYGSLGGWFRYARVAAPTIFFYSLVPLAYISYFVYRRFRKPSIETDKGLVFLSITGLVLYLGVSAPTGFRLYHIAIPAVIVFSWLQSQVVGRRLEMLLAVLLVMLGVAYSVQRQMSPNATVELPAGSAAFLSPTMAEKYVWLKDNSAPGDIIYEAQHPTYYFPLHLKNPTPFYLVRDNNYTPRFQVDQLVSALNTRKPRFIIWHGLWSKEEQDRKPGDNLAPLWMLIRSNYELRKEFREFGEFTTNSERDIEIWELRQK